MNKKTTPLDNATAKKLLKQGLGAENSDNKTKSITAIFAGRICTVFNLVNAIIAIALLAVGSYKNLAFLGVVFANTFIGVFQEIKAKLITGKILKAEMPSVTVIRADGELTLKWSHAVKGDTIILREGNSVRADCMIINGYCEYDDSALTGEFETINAHEGDIIPSGAAIVAGEVTCVIYAVGNETKEYAIRQSSRRLKLKKSIMIDTLNNIIKFISFALIPLGAILFIKLFVITGSDITQSVNSVAASIVGMIPSGLILLTSTALAVSVVRLSSKHMLINEMNSIEMIARANVLCIDKTGTLTTGRLVAEKLIDCFPKDECLRALKTVATCCNNATVAAINDYCDNIIPYTAIDTVPFSSKRKYSAVICENTTYVLGAPEVLLCKNDYCKYDIATLCHTYRIVCLCCKQNSDNTDITNGLRLMCFVLLSEKLRAGVEETIEQLQSQGVCVKVISGDNPITVSASAQKCKIANAEKYIDLSSFTCEQFQRDCYALASQYTVFGRATPEQKRQLVSSLKSAGNIVAMTGDGINDMPAMKESSCSIALANAADAAKCAADITLSANGFYDIPLVINEGRTVINNINSYAALFLTKTIMSFVLTSLFIFVPWSFDLQPIQLTLIGSLLIGLPAFLLSLLHNTTRPDGRLTERILCISFPAGVFAAASCLSLASLGVNGNAWGYSIAAAFCAVLIAVCIPLNFKKALICFCPITILVICLIFAGEFFEITLDAAHMTSIIISVAATVAATAVSISIYIKNRK